tara:strand:- start:9691 stop:10800 length:1110 start_codon:yes stop_codon:yes gene_type:complete
MSTYYVSQDSGNDSNAGSEASPFRTLSHAFHIAGNTGSGITYGNTIIINDSATYDVTNGTAGVDNTSNQVEATTGWLPREFVIKAGSGCSPTLDGGYNADFAIKHYTDWVIQGITFKRFGSNTANHAAIQEVTSRQTAFIRDCKIHQVTGTGIYTTDEGTTVERCEIFDCTGYGYRGFEECIIKNNLIYNCASSAIHGGYGVRDSPTIQHNTVSNCPRSGSDHGSRQYAIRSRTAEYNIVVSASCTIAAISTNGTHSYNCVTGTYDHKGENSPTNYSGGPGTGDLEADPLLVVGSLKLSEDSPCLGAAVGSTRTVDFTSGSLTWVYPHKVMNVSSSAKPNDMGAYELNYTTVTGVNTSIIHNVLSASAS